MEPRTVSRLSTMLNIGEREVAGRQPDERHRAAAAQHADSLPEGLGRNRGHEHALAPPTSSCTIAAGSALRGVDAELRAELSRERELVVGDVNGDDV